MRGGARVWAVSYLNAVPMVYGLRHSGSAGLWDVQVDLPYRCAARLQRGEADIALMPVALLPDISGAQLVGGYCIGSIGAVGSVCLYSEVPVEQVQRIYLDPHSRTSVALCRLLAREYWKITPQYLSLDLLQLGRPLSPGEALLLIGDKALAHRDGYPYCYDLGSAWSNYTGLPFVYAAWVSRGPVREDFTLAFDAAIAWGLQHRDEALAAWEGPLPTTQANAAYYLAHNIDYRLTRAKLSALRRFLGHYQVQSEPLSAGGTRLA